MYAIECAMDELAYAAKIDPLELRLINYSDTDQMENRPYSSKALRECYRQAAEKFGWSKRSREPRSMREGNDLVGWGMASGIWEAMQLKASARAVLTANGSVEIASATADIGPGTYTMMAQIAAELLGVPLESVTVKLGDSSLPDAPVEGGSFTTSSVGSAIHGACRAVQKELLQLAQKAAESPLAGAKLDDVLFADGKIRHNRDPRREVSLADAMRAGRADRIEKEATAEPERGQQIFALHPLGGVRRGAGRCGARGHSGHARGQRGGGRPHSQSEGCRQPDSRGRGRRHRHGAARGDLDRPSVRALHEP